MDLGNLISSLVSGFAGLGGIALQGRFNDKNLKKQYQYNEMAADSALGRQKDFLDYSFGASAEYEQKMSQYNWDNFASPAAQAKAYQEAGFNPALALDSGSAGSLTSGIQSNAPSSSSGPQGAGVSAQHLDVSSVFDGFSSMIKSIVELRKLPLELDNLGEDIKDKQQGRKESESRIALNDSIIELNTANAKFLKEDTRRVSLMNKLSKATFDLDVENRRLTNKQLDELNKLYSEQLNSVRQDVREKIRKNDIGDIYDLKNAWLQQAQMRAEIALLDTKADYYREYTRLTAKQRKAVQLDIIAKLQDVAETMFTQIDGASPLERENYINALGKEKVPPISPNSLLARDARAAVEYDELVNSWFGTDVIASTITGLTRGAVTAALLKK